jgi:hypothetical protein
MTPTLGMSGRLRVLLAILLLAATIGAGLAGAKLEARKGFPFDTHALGALAIERNFEEPRRSEIAALMNSPATDAATPGNRTTFAFRKGADRPL